MRIILHLRLQVPDTLSWMCRKIPYAPKLQDDVPVLRRLTIDGPSVLFHNSALWHQHGAVIGGWQKLRDPKHGVEPGRGKPDTMGASQSQCVCKHLTTLLESPGVHAASPDGTCQAPGGSSMRTVKCARRKAEGIADVAQSNPPRIVPGAPPLQALLQLILTWLSSQDKTSSRPRESKEAQKSELGVVGAGSLPHHIREYTLGRTKASGFMLGRS
nr:hypothetical protein CFP56_70671 [Quercus suber]